VLDIGPLKDGECLLAWYVGGKRSPNVARFQIDKDHDIRNEPLIELVEIEPGPGQELPFLGIRACRRTEDDPAFTARDVAWLTRKCPAHQSAWRAPINPTSNPIQTAHALSPCMHPR